MLDGEASGEARPELAGAALAAHLGAPLLPGNSIEVLLERLRNHGALALKPYL